MKDLVCATVGILGATLASYFGGWSAGLTTLVFFMTVDYISGLIVAGVFKKSKKTETGALESRAGWKGLCRKCMTFVYVLIAYRLDLMTGSSFLHDCVIIGFTTNELISITENAGLMGIPIPDAIIDAIDMLQSRNKR